MSQVTLPYHEGPWSEDDYLALGETDHRIELIDGSLWVSPAPNRPHQHISAFLWLALQATARTAGFQVLLTTNLRLATGRILIPDLVVDNGPPLEIVGEATDAVLVCEITSPSNATSDRILKRALYAEAGVPWYLLVEPDFSDYASLTLRLFRLTGREYVEHALAKQGETLRSRLPFPISISTDDLISPWRE
ncbi:MULTISPECIES: Uma2 family endonuclease [unclassified Actinoplanes]|uniref:Uma2 family endonuclease n=1 Tax=unclassified Actinoplanes TaxID=2626549 RepID=UPI0005BB671F|nr:MULTISPECIES: Uma2 family endonuclease [unclassified Actinoplanes]